MKATPLQSFSSYEKANLYTKEKLSISLSSYGAISESPLTCQNGTIKEASLRNPCVLELQTLIGQTRQALNRSCARISKLDTEIKQTKDKLTRLHEEDNVTELSQILEIIYLKKDKEEAKVVARTTRLVKLQKQMSRLTN